MASPLWRRDLQSNLNRKSESMNPSVHLLADITATSKKQSDYAKDQLSGDGRKRFEEFILSGGFSGCFIH